MSNHAKIEELQRIPPLSQLAYARTKHAILAGQLPAGEYLSDSKVAQLLGISRTPAREAIIALRQEGLISQSPSNRFRVRLLSRDELLELFIALELLEPLLVHRASAKIELTHLRVLQEIVDHGWRALHDLDFASVLSYRRRFHHLLATPAYCPPLADTVLRHYELIDLFLINISRKICPTTLGFHQSLADEQHVIHYLRLRQGVGAGRRAIHHLKTLRRIAERTTY